MLYIEVVVSFYILNKWTKWQIFMYIFHVLPNYLVSLLFFFISYFLFVSCVSIVHIQAYTPVEKFKVYMYIFFFFF